MQKNHIGGIHIAKKIALCIFLVSATLSALPESTFGATSSVFQVISKRVTISMKNATLETILAEMNRQAGLDYGFQSNGPEIHPGSNECYGGRSPHDIVKRQSLYLCSGEKSGCYNYAGKETRGIGHRNRTGGG